MGMHFATRESAAKGAASGVSSIEIYDWHVAVADSKGGALIGGGIEGSGSIIEL